jgi:hypothetical protein
MANEHSQVGSYRLAGYLPRITWSFVPLDLILPDQPNRAVRTRMLRGVGGGAARLLPIPIGHFFTEYQ